MCLPRGHASSTTHEFTILPLLFTLAAGPDDDDDFFYMLLYRVSNNDPYSSYSYVFCCCFFIYFSRFILFTPTYDILITTFHRCFLFIIIIYLIRLLSYFFYNYLVSPLTFHLFLFIYTFYCYILALPILIFIHYILFLLSFCPFISFTTPSSSSFITSFSYPSPSALNTYNDQQGTIWDFATEEIPLPLIVTRFFNSDFY